MSAGFETMRRVYMHPGLAESDLQQLFQAHEKVVFAKGDMLLQEGRVPNDYCIIEKGLVRSFVYDYNGNDITTNFFTENEVVIEESALFQRTASKENFEALTDCECWRIDFDSFQVLFHSIQNLSEWGRAWMSLKLFETKQRSLEIITDSATDRYLRLIAEKPSVIRFAPLKNIATYLGVTDSSLSRIRREISTK